MPLAMLSTGLLLLFVRSHLSAPVLRAVLLPLAYGSFTLALFEGAGSIRSLLTWQRRRD